MKNLFKKNLLLCITAGYGIIYMTWFTYLEQRTNVSVHIIHSALDNYIPFIEVFVLPYFIWFPFVGLFGMYFYLKDKREFSKLITNLMLGMTVFLVVSALFPNGHDLRPETFARDNVFTRMVKHLYTIDTPTNILPSIHVYNTLCIYMAVKNSRSFNKKFLWHNITLILSILIIASTVFIKQHTIIDVIAAFALEAPAAFILYKMDWSLKGSYNSRHSKYDIEA